VPSNKRSDRMFLHQGGGDAPAVRGLWLGGAVAISARANGRSGRASAPLTSWEAHGRVALTGLLHDLDGQALLAQVMGQIDPEMVSDMPSRTPGGFEIGQILDLEILCKADPAGGMEGVARHGCTRMA
jgi:hypothetical protein